MSRKLVIFCLFLPVLATGAIAQTGSESGSAAVALTLEQARSRAVAQSPVPRSVTFELEAAEADFRMAGLWPNPEFEVEVEELDGFLSRSEDSETRVSVQQALPLFAREARRRVAQMGREEARIRVELARLDLVAEVESRFWRVVAAQEQLALADWSSETAAEVVATVRALVQAGEVSPLDLLRAEAEEIRARSALGAAHRELEAARLGLAEAMGDETPAFSKALDELPTGIDGRDAGTNGPGLDETADMRLLAASENRLAADVSLARRVWWPDPAVRIGTSRRASDRETSYLASLVIQIPAWDRGQHAVAAARARQHQGREQRRSELLRLKLARAAAHAAFDSALAEVQMAMGELLPRATAVFAGVSEGYRRGKLGLLEVLEARRGVVAARESSVEARLRLALARIEWERRSSLGVDGNAGGAR